MLARYPREHPPSISVSQQLRNQMSQHLFSGMDDADADSHLSGATKVLVLLKPAIFAHEDSK